MWRDHIPSVSNRLSIRTGIRSAQTPSGLRSNLNGFAVTDGIAKTHRVAGVLKLFDSIRRKSRTLERQEVGSPLIVKPRRGYGLKDIHFVNQNIEQNL